MKKKKKNIIRLETDFKCKKHNKRHYWITPKYWGCPICYKKKYTLGI